MLITYIQVVTGYIPCSPENPRYSVVTLRGDERTLTLNAERHAGGQRLRLPPAAQEFFLNALEKGETLCLELEGYSEEIEAKGFARALAKMAHPGLRLNFRFPY